MLMTISSIDVNTMAGCTLVQGRTCKQAYHTMQDWPELYTETTWWQWNNMDRLLHHVPG